MPKDFWTGVRFPSPPPLKSYPNSSGSDLGHFAPPLKSYPNSSGSDLGHFAPPNTKTPTNSVGVFMFYRQIKRGIEQGGSEAEENSSGNCFCRHGQRARARR